MSSTSYAVEFIEGTRHVVRKHAEDGTVTESDSTFHIDYEARRVVVLLSPGMGEAERARTHRMIRAAFAAGVVAERGRVDRVAAPAAGA